MLTITEAQRLVRDWKGETRQARRRRTTPTLITLAKALGVKVRYLLK